MATKRYYVVGGMGNSNANVIEAGLSDVAHNAHFIYLWTGKPTDGQARVLDWLVDHGAEYTVVHSNGKVHPVVEGAAGEVLKVDDLVLDALNLYPKCEVLLLWDQDEAGNPTAMTEHLTVSALGLGIPVLDLCNGLVPLSLEEAPEAPQAATPAATPEPENTPLKTAPNASQAILSVCYVSEGGSLRHYMGTKDEVLHFVNSL